MSHLECYPVKLQGILKPIPCLLTILNLFHGRPRSAFMARPCSGAMLRVNPASWRSSCRSFLLRCLISSLICDAESPQLTKSRIPSMALFLRAMVLLLASLVDTTECGTLTKVSGYKGIFVFNNVCFIHSTIPFQMWTH